MRTALKLMMPLAAAAIPVAMMSPAHADDDDTSYQATLNPINDSGGSGMVTITFDGDEATVKENVSGLAATFEDGPYPHAQHVHIGGQGKCPTNSADKNDDGIVDTTEGQDAYGEVNTSLTTKGDTSADSAVEVDRFPGGAKYEYERTFTMDSDSISAIKNENAVAVVHGLDPSGLSDKAQDEDSNLDDDLPLAATSPALCGTLSKMPSGGPQTGAGSTAGPENLGLAGTAAGMIVLGGGALLWTRRRNESRSQTSA